MKVMYIQDIGDIGGATNSLKELVLKLNSKYNIIPIIVTSDYNSVNKYAIDNNFEQYNVNHKQIIVPSSENKMKNLLKHLFSPLLYCKNNIYNHIALKKLEKNIDFKTISLIHTNVNRIGLGFIISKKYKIKHVVHLREFGDLDYNCFPIKKKYINYMNKYTTKFIAISNVISQHWINKGIDKNKIEIIYNGVNDIKVTKIKEKNKKINLVFCGQICENKGQIQVIKALTLLDNSTLEQLHIDFYGLGDPNYIEKLNKIIKKAGIEKIITFKGFNKSMREKLQNYDIGFVCSKSEAFGRVTVEYMLSKVLVIASNSGANLEIIDDNQSGLIYKYNDIADLANKIKKAILLLESKSSIIDNAYEKAKNNFISDINSKNIYNLYCKILNDQVNNQ